ncbi:hypothetical protein SPRG_12581 [Saprolegnia parasitica CBS 223.65]|uniref:Uncharacterized protein n=1 Tax=Saprolegnia parasitica (strain CBS 223.65) TaxID=695850 RepID=A0A067C7S4_SAPPC|nr:hypothetical protein SPRG_12581 [Saprolegnia parasitica CBS 223.65]KDO22601.1 hypothetical protein SPRG_12581 [Saprolegnia parasitica CBS 223.65]|eukprot:XP_012206717.1 hypothetical protein SPRG_12581 [Saprolegnia parasitica CBS 223.65]
MVRRPFIKAALDGVLPSKKLKRQIEHMQGTLHHAHEAYEQATHDLAAMSTQIDSLSAENAQLRADLEAAQAKVAQLTADQTALTEAHEMRVYRLEAELRLQDALKLRFNAERMASELEAMQAHAEHQRRLNQLESDLIMARETLHCFMRQQAKLRASGQGDIMSAAHVHALEAKCRDLNDDLHVYMQLNAFLRQENNEKTLALQAALHNLYDAKRKTLKSPRKPALVVEPAPEYIEDCTSSSDSEDLNQETQYVDWDADHDAAVFQSLHGLIQKRALKALTPLQIPTKPASSRIHHAKGMVRKRSPRKPHASPKGKTSKVCHTAEATAVCCI